MVNNKKNNSESGGESFDDDEDYEAQAPVSVGTKSTIIVDKVLGRRFIKISSSQSESSSNESSYEELFFIKWRNMSYLHSSWEKREDIERFDPQGKVKLKRFLLAPHPPGVLGEIRESSESAQGRDGEEDEEEIDYFNPDLIEVQRIISCDTFTCWHKTAKTHNNLMNPPVQAKRSCKGVGIFFAVLLFILYLTPRNYVTAKKAKVVYKDEDEEWDANDDLEWGNSQGSTSSSLNYADSEVKYLVKWRGLPYSECSWERWVKDFFIYSLLQPITILIDHIPGGYQDCELPSVEVLANSKASSFTCEEEPLSDSPRVSEIDQVACFRIR